MNCEHVPTGPPVEDSQTPTSRELSGTLAAPVASMNIPSGLVSPTKRDGGGLSGSMILAADGSTVDW